MAANELSSGDISAIVEPMWAHLRARTASAGDLSTATLGIQSIRASIDAVKNTTECEIRLLAYEHALRLKPTKAASHMVEVFDALELSTTCKVDRPEPKPLPKPSFPIPAAKDCPRGIFFVDPSGNDKANGDESAPFATVGRALAATRANRKTVGAGGIGAAIVLRKGTHYLATGLNLTAVDSGLTITNYPGEESWLSGGVALKTQWKPFNTTGMPCTCPIPLVVFC